MFYGVQGIEDLFGAARAGGFDWYYADNAYFDCARGTHFRVAKNALQLGGTVAPDWKRCAALGLEEQPWQRDGRHIVVVMQSAHFMREVAQWPGGADGWQRLVLQTLKKHTDRPIVVRHWERDKARRASSLHQELKGAWAVVTHMSAAANEAVLAGIPVFCTGRCAALPMGLSDLTQIEHPRRPDGRQEWAAMLAARQWTLEEIERGEAWRAITASG